MSDASRELELEALGTHSEAEQLLFGALLHDADFDPAPFTQRLIVAAAR